MSRLRQTILVLWITAASFCMWQCESEPLETELQITSGRSALTAAELTRILGFEDAGDWTASSGTIALSEYHVQGGHGLSVDGQGWIELVSAPLSTLPDVDSTLAVSIRLPVEQPEPYWYGQIALLIDLPSKGLYHRWIGERPLTGLSLESFATIEFDLPQDVVQALQQSYSDLRFKVVLNVPYNATGEYVLDALRFGELGTGPAILLGSDRDRALLEDRTALSTVGDSIVLLGQVKDDTGVASVSIRVNGGPEIVPMLDSENKFEELLQLAVDPDTFLNTNTVEVTAVDIDGNIASKTVAVESVGIRVPGEVAVLFKAESAEADRQATLAGIGATVLASASERIKLIRVPAGTELQAVQTLLADESVRAALPNFPVLPTREVNDMYFPRQWNLERIGAPEAWDVSWGSEDIIVAVLDSGVLYDGGYIWMSHPCEVKNGGNYFDYDAPIMSNLWLNEKECCEMPPCNSSCFPSLPQDDQDTCPRADLNADGCPGSCGVDDDGDGSADYADPDVRTLFSNGKDDDGDGLIDEQGPGNTPCTQVTAAQMQNAASDFDCDGAANDDDENGYPDDCRGFQFGRLQGTLEDYYGNSIAPNDPSDLAGGHQGGTTIIGHGTMTAQIVGELGDNCYGYIGVAPRVKIMPLGVGRYSWDDEGRRSLMPMPDFFSILEAYEYAAENGASITNASLSAPCNCLPVGDPGCVWHCPWGDELSKEDAADEASLFLSETSSQHILHVIGAGNAVAGGTGQNLDEVEMSAFPQNVHLPNVISVAASDYGDNRAEFSHYGVESVSIAAPGDDLDFHAGTSAAAPHVAGAAVLLMAAMPELRGQPERTIALLEDTARQLPQWQGVVRSGGILDIDAAIHAVPEPTTLFSEVSDTWLSRSGRDLQTNDIDLVDVDGDGDLDILELPCNPTGELSASRLLINEDGQFKDRSTAQWPQALSSHCDGDFGDIDGDGDVDVVAAGYYPVDEANPANLNQLYLNNGSGSFSIGTAGRLPGADSATRAAALCDLDGDGDLDLFTGNFKSVLDPNHVVNRVYINNGAGVFTEETSSRLLNVNRPEVGAPNKIVCADLTQPIVSVCDPSLESCKLCADPTIAITEIAARGTVPDMTQCSTIRQAISPEIVVANSQGTFTRYFENQGAGILVEATDKLQLPVIDGVRQEQDVEAADFDGDGDRDLMFVTVRGARNFMLLNDGTGTFSEAPSQPIFTVGDWAREVEAADFDNDGDIDIIILRGDPNAVKPGYHAYYRNEGGAVFTEVSAGIDTLYLITVDGDAGDIDNDGDIDLVIGNHGAMNQVMRNNTITCGNGIVEGGEECDDGNTAIEACAYGQSGCTVCGALCTEVEGLAHYCGDNTVDSGEGEECDDGNTIVDGCTYGETTCTVCGGSCTEVEGLAHYCGDNTVDSGEGEECDDGNTAVESCTYGQTGCTVCGAVCTEVEGIAHYCGDGTVDSGEGEECDDGNTVPGDDCDEDCQTENTNPCDELSLSISGATASSVENGGYPASNAVDNNLGTRWSSTFSDPQWLSVDLGASVHVSRVSLVWEGAASADYDIQMSNTGQDGTWSTVHTQSNGQGGTESFTGLNGVGRYLRIYSRARTTQWGVSLFEVRVYGDSDPTCQP